MRRSVEIGGRRFTFELFERGDGRFEATLEAETGERSWSAPRVVSAGDDGNPTLVEVDAVVFEVAAFAGEFHLRGHADLRAVDRGRAPLRTSEPPPAQRHAELVTAPMPGRIVTLFVRPGKVVAAGERVAVIEAMKMQNELTSAHGGTVRRVWINEGDVVDRGAPLVELTP
jgi:biotin carboxyl carrier protein